MILAMVIAATTSASTLEIGAAAPDFTLKALDGTEHTLSALKGKTVVLEWFNPGCPYVVYAHGEGPLKERAKQVVADDVVWLAVNSGAPGLQGHGLELNREAAARWGMTHPVLLDESGAVGKLYDAATTPQMVVIDAEGVIRYNGALDNAPRGKHTGDRVDYFGNALTAVQAGQPVATPRTKPYGCSVKYGASG